MPLEAPVTMARGRWFASVDLSVVPIAFQNNAAHLSSRCPMTHFAWAAYRSAAECACCTDIRNSRRVAKIELQPNPRRSYSPIVTPSNSRNSVSSHENRRCSDDHLRGGHGLSSANHRELHAATAGPAGSAQLVSDDPQIFIWRMMPDSAYLAIGYWC